MARPNGPSKNENELLTEETSDVYDRPVAFPNIPRRRLEDILRALPEQELDGLIQRMGIRIDLGKRIDKASQVARILVGIADIRDPSRLQTSSRELLYRIAESGGVIVVSTLPIGLDILMAKGLVYARKLEKGIEIVLPSSFMVQLKGWENEDPRSLRALISQASFETVNAIATHYLGRPATPPVALSLETAWETLSETSLIMNELQKLSQTEMRLLQAIEEMGGEVDTEELLDLEKEPMRLRGIVGVTTSRRGTGFSLERRAFLIPVSPNRFVIPIEISNIIGSERREYQESNRSEIRSFLIEEDHAPRRAKFSNDPAMLAIGLAYCVREPDMEFRSGIGTPRSLLVRLSQRLGRDLETIALITALSRAIGLWEPSAMSIATPPGNLRLSDLTPLLFSVWKRGGAWDEARPDHEALRISQDARDYSPISTLREIVINALLELGEGKWIPWTSLEKYILNDTKMNQISRLIKRWSNRVGIATPTMENILRSIVLETLHALGIVDIGGDVDEFHLSESLAIKVTQRGRMLLTAGNTNSLQKDSSSKFINTHTLAISGNSKVADVLALTQFAELNNVEETINITFSPASMSRAMSTGIESDLLKTRIENIAPLPNSISQMLAQVSVILGRGTFVACSGFLWIEDSEVRTMLSTKKPTADLFIDPSPPSGLLISQDVDMERLIRRLRSVGVEIIVEGNVLRARQPTIPPSGAELPRRSASVTARLKSRTIPPPRDK